MSRLWPFPALKTGMDIRGQVWRSVGKRHFFLSVLAAHPQKDLPKETAGNCSFLKLSKFFRARERFQRAIVNGIFRALGQLLITHSLFIAMTPSFQAKEQQDFNFPLKAIWPQPSPPPRPQQPRAPPLKFALSLFFKVAWHDTPLCVRFT